MTAAQLQQFSGEALERLWPSLKADRLPVGTYDGEVWPRPRWPAWWMLWRGKHFSRSCTCDRGTHGVVANRIGPLLLIPGETWLDDGEVLIDYPQLGLQDRLKPVSDTLWLGRLALRGKTVWFTLEAAK